MAPLASIVTPVLDAIAFLPELLASVRAQGEGIEHVVVDGGSTDGSLELLQRTPGIHLLTGADRGMYDAIGRGLAATTGAMVAYQNADDRYVPGAVETARAFLAAHPDVDVVYGDYRLIDARGAALGERRSPPFDARLLERTNFVPPHSTFLRRVLIERGLMPDAALRYAGDWEWFLRLARAGARFAHLPQVLSEFRVHPAAKTSRWSLVDKMREWRLICARHDVSFARLVWHEAFYGPLKRRRAQ